MSKKANIQPIEGLTKEMVSSLLVKHLKVELKTRGLDYRGRKKDLAHRLVQYLETQQHEKEEENEVEEEEKEESEVEKEQEVVENEVETDTKEEETRNEQQEIQESNADVHDTVIEENGIEEQQELKENETSNSDQEKEIMQIEEAQRQQESADEDQDNEQEIDDKEIVNQTAAQEEVERNDIEMEESSNKRRRSESDSDNENDEGPSKKRHIDLPEGATTKVQIDNFTRPLRVPDVKKLLSEFGRIDEFKMNDIRSRAIVKYTNIEDAARAYTKLQGLQWQDFGKTLFCTFMKDETVENSGQEEKSVDLDHLFRRTKATPSIFYLPRARSKLRR